ncbi:MAG: ABC transporter ATP-binding protein [Burkholderiales bacterium]|nr:ABC transporter ATP-binding protein [Burkholderiales bacterium]
MSEDVVAEPVGVEVRDVSLAFGELTVLDRIDLKVAPGEFFALLGPSGCGKSTLLRLIAGFNRARSGQVLVDGVDIGEVLPWKRNIGMVFQNYALWPHMSVARNVAFGLEERRLPRAAVRRGVDAALALVGLADLAGRRPGQLSGGQQQRVALARTLAMEPRVLLLDEPLSNLDAKLRHHMRRELVALQRRLGITTLFVTHDQEEALTTADRIAVMEGGRIVQAGTPMQLFDAPESRFVAEFIGAINLLPGTLSRASGGSLRFRGPTGEFGLPPLPALTDSGTVTLAFRPHTVTAVRPDAAAGAGRIWIEARISEREFLGEYVRYRALAGGVELVADIAHRAGDPGFAGGAAVKLGIDTSAITALRA